MALKILWLITLLSHMALAKTGAPAPYRIQFPADFKVIDSGEGQVHPHRDAVQTAIFTGPYKFGLDEERISVLINDKISQTDCQTGAYDGEGEVHRRTIDGLQFFVKKNETRDEGEVETATFYRTFHGGQCFAIEVFTKTHPAMEGIVEKESRKRYLELRYPYRAHLDQEVENILQSFKPE